MKTGITGGIGSGKSYVCRLLSDMGISVYDCDAAAKRLMVSSAAIRRKLTELIGPETYNISIGDEGQENFTLNKSVVAQFLMESESNANAIDSIVHPAVFDDFLSSGMEWVESALLFQAGMNKLVDRVVAVIAPRDVRISRVMERDAISRDEVLEWMDKQWPQKEIIRRADYVIVNDGHQQLLPQLKPLLKIEN